MTNNDAKEWALTALASANMMPERVEVGELRIRAYFKVGFNITEGVRRKLAAVGVNVNMYGHELIDGYAVPYVAFRRAA